MKSRLSFLIAACTAIWLWPSAAHAQLVTQNDLAPEQLVSNILVGQGVSVSNVTYNGIAVTVPIDQVGSFTGTSSNLGLDYGIVLSTGKVEGVEGPNQSTSTTVPPDNPNNNSDPDLAQYVYMQRCVAVLEFDFIPTGDTLSFRFVFGSEEYPEYVCSMFNDVFGFFLSGPGIDGTFSNNGINLATIPGGDIPVMVNTVNPGVPGALGGGGSGCASSDPNWQNNSIYYVDNTGGATVELDGFTVPLTAGARVQCGETYHIKIAIAHGADSNLDSAVFIEGGSFTSAGHTVTATTPFDDGILTEGCGAAMVTITRPVGDEDMEVNLSYEGPGITPGDLEGALEQVVIPAGESSITFPITAVEDGLDEGAEELTILATAITACGYAFTDSVTITLHDYDPIDITLDDLWLNCDQDSVLLEATVTGGLGELTLVWGDDHTPGPYYAPGMEDGQHTVYVTDECPKTVEATMYLGSGCTIWVPNVFTPNNDGDNDAWRIGGWAPGRKVSVQVLNRWGNVIYESANYGNNWKAPDVPDGTYYYYVVDGRTGDKFTGHLTILSNGRE